MIQLQKFSNEFQQDTVTTKAFHHKQFILAIQYSKASYLDSEPVKLYS